MESCPVLDSWYENKNQSTCGISRTLSGGNAVDPEELTFIFGGGCTYLWLANKHLPYRDFRHMHCCPAPVPDLQQSGAEFLPRQFLPFPTVGFANRDLLFFFPGRLGGVTAHTTVSTKFPRVYSLVLSNAPCASFRSYGRKVE